MRLILSIKMRIVSGLVLLFLIHASLRLEAATLQSPQEDDTYPGLGISGNPAATNVSTGSGEAQRLLLQQFGVKDDHGVQFGGLWLADFNWLMSGGKQPGAISRNSALILDNHIDLQKLTGWWKGGSFGAEFLQLNADPTNNQAGSVQGYNGIPGPDPLTRSELYQLWVRQELFDGKFSIRVGKVSPIFDFGNVLRPVPLDERESFIPSVSGLLFSPIFINPTMIGASPGFYNSACGVTLNFTPVKWWYLNYGVYDGNNAKREQTGLQDLKLNGYYFHIAETGLMWRLGPDRLPGQFSVGGWHQTGELQGPPGVSEDGADGVYAFASQCLWHQHPFKDNSGISSYFQVGANDSKTLPMNQACGAGFTGFGLVPTRPSDSVGIGMSWSWLNEHIFHRNSELMFQSYYQARIMDGVYLQPTLTYIPTPGASPDFESAWATSLRLTVIF